MGDKLQVEDHCEMLIIIFIIGLMFKLIMIYDHKHFSAYNVGFIFVFCTSTLYAYYIYMFVAVGFHVWFL